MGNFTDAFSMGGHKIHDIDSGIKWFLYIQTFFKKMYNQNLHFWLFLQK